MNELPDTIREQLAEFAAVVIEQHQSPMKKLGFAYFNSSNQITASEERLI